MFSTQMDFLNWLILMIIIRRGGEWPDWNGDLHDQVFVGVAIEKIATHVRDQKVRSQLQNIAAEVIHSQADKMFQK